MRYLKKINVAINLAIFLSLALKPVISMEDVNNSVPPSYLGMQLNKMTGNGEYVLFNDDAEFLKAPSITEINEWFNLAESGHSTAQYNVGLCCERGIGVEKNLTEAVKWYTLAAAQGDIEALNALGISYNFGIGVEKNLTEAVKWYALAAIQGEDEHAYFNLGACYESGEGVELNEKRAAHLYAKAADKGMSLALQRLNVCLDKIRRSKVNISAE